MRILTTLVAILLSFQLYSQQYEFSRVDNTNGLSSNQVENIFKDSRGFIWFATNMGLNRYDGVNFKVYTHSKNDPQSSPCDRYNYIREDNDGRLWLRYNENDYVAYDLSKELFIQHIDSVLQETGLPPGPVVLDISPDRNIYCYYKNDGIYKYDNVERKVIAYKQGVEVGLSDGEVTEMKISADYIWLLYRSGLVERINENTGKVDFRSSFFKEGMATSTIRKSLFVDSDQEVWVYPGISDQGIAYFDSKEQKWLILGEEKDIKLSSDFVRCIDEDKDGLLWIGTDHGGVNLFDKKTKQVKVLKNNLYDSRSIGQNSIISLFCDNNGIVWVGTYKDGVSYYHNDIYKFKKNKLSSFFEQKSETFDCNSIYMDGKDNLWIGTNGKGLVKYNEKKGQLEIFKYNPSDKNGISSNIITSIFEDHTGALWIGTFFGGLNSYFANRFTNYQIKENDPNSLTSKSVYGLTEDDSNNLWIGTLGGGVNMLDASRKNFSHFNIGTSPELYSNFILSISSDTEKNMYLCSDLGVNIIGNEDKKITSLFDRQFVADSLTSCYCNNMIVDSRGLYWIATDKGLNIYNSSDKSLLQINKTDGLPSDEVVSLIEDNNGNVWAGTRGGLAYISCSFNNDKFNYYITSFSEKDGLPSAVCNLNAIYKDRDGIIYVGFTRGYVSFDPSDIASNTDVPEPRFTDLLIANQEIKPGVKYKNRVIIDESVCNLQEITLNYDETNFTVLFSALSYINPEKNHYRYRLEGLEKEWNEIKNGAGAASYSNLSAGWYKLIVYASNGDNVWADEPIELKIIVKPPFWFSWWAYIIYFVFIVLLFRWFVKWKLNKQKHEFEQTQKILEANRTHELDELKIRFFTNISHEFKTPLTLILTPIEKLLKEAHTKEEKNMLSIVYRNARNLLKMVNDILDFRRFDLSKMTLNLTNGNIVLFIRDICQTFSSMASEKSINLTFTTFVDNLRIDFDPEKIEKIVTNLLSNALKYTESGQVDVSLGIRESLQADSQNYLSIKVADTGVGIEEKELNKIFERFYRVENSDQLNHQPGTGIGLHLVSEYVKLHNGEIAVESTVGKGTCITVFIPVLQTDYSFSGKQETIELIGEESLNTRGLNKENGDSVLRKNLPTLLIVDDNEDFCRFIKALFTGDYHIITAHDGEEGYAILLDQLADIILCDVMMPVMDGYEFCRKVKGDIRTSHIPIILLTAKSSEENQYLGIEAGADDYIAKPFNIDMLKLKIAKIIEKQKNLHSDFKKRIDISPREIEIKTMDEKFVEKAISIVEKNIGDSDFLVEDLCKEMAMSRVYFYKKILALTDKTPSEFMRFIRLKRAADLLEKSQMFVNEIAFQVGFNDPKYFRKYFKEEFGVTPNEYKKKFSGDK